MLNRLTRGETSIQIELKVMDVLVCLAKRAGQLVTRQEIFDAVWGTEFISDNTLNHAIALLRSSLDDDARSPSYVETIHRKGYRLIAPVAPGVTDQDGGATTNRRPAHDNSGQIADDREPYPGLAAFTESDAELFFGRDAEVARIWRRLTSRRLLAVTGPSGVGKSSLLRAGVIPAAPHGWGVAYCQPGEEPMRELARVSAPDIGRHGTDDSDTVFSSMSGWRNRYDQALLVVDQFEELFTLNPPGISERYAAFLRRLADEADIHVLLGVRDDYLLRCHDHEQLTPIFSELTPIKAPHDAALKDAIVRPSFRFGYAFEDENLVDELSASIDGERAALPLLAFSLARLWEERDPEQRIISRKAYERIGGIEEALPYHAETTLQEIGSEHIPIVREIFMNLVTAHGTRTIRETGELLTVFNEDQRENASRILQQLVDARLLTAFEEKGKDGNSGRRHVEVIHESLLTAWPRLARWRMQDAGDAEFRDQLRQAARLWEERKRPDDLLWTGTTYREFRLWRERCKGGLTEIEGSFSDAVIEHSSRRRRRRRFRSAAVIAALLGIIAALGWSWNLAAIEARNATAQELVLLAEREEETSARLAFALASLEITDTAAARGLVVRTLWQGPPARYIASQRNEEWASRHIGRTDPSMAEAYRAPFGVDFSPDGRRLASGHVDGLVKVWEEQGGPSTDLFGHRGYVGTVRFGPRGDRLFTAAYDERVIVWSLQTAEQERVIAPGGLVTLFPTPDGRRFITESGMRHSHETVWQSWPVEGGDPILLGRVTHSRPVSWILDGISAVHPNGKWAALHSSGRVLALYPIDELDGPPIRVLGQHEDEIEMVAISSDGRRYASCDEQDQIRVWIVSSEGDSAMFRAMQGCNNVRALRLNPDGSRLAAVCDSGWAFVWDLDGPPGAEPTRLSHHGQLFQAAFHPSGKWLATTNWSEAGLVLWPQGLPLNRILKGHPSQISGLGFAPNGNWLASGSRDGVLKIWNLSPEANVGSQSFRALSKGWEERINSIAVAPNGKIIAVGTLSGEVRLVGWDGEPLHSLGGLYNFVEDVVFDRESRLLAVRGSLDPDNNHVTVWNLESQKTQRLDAGDGLAIRDFEFTDDGELLTSSEGGLLLWDLETGEHSVLREDPSSSLAVDPAGRWVVLVTEGGVVRRDFGSGAERILSPVGTRVVLDETGDIAVISCEDGSIRVCSTLGGEPHLLLGHRYGTLTETSVSPDGRWIASGDVDGSIRLWPMPDLTRPPLHTLPREQLIAKLETLTNLRAVRDPDSPTGWKVEIGPFPGWAEVPEW